MKCIFCNTPATVHVTDVVNGKKREVHLCQGCARERNLLPDPPGPQIDLNALVDLLAAPLAGSQTGPLIAPHTPHTPPTSRPGSESTEPVCPACGLTYAAFKAEGRFGCGHDYSAFRESLEPLLERIHRATAHVGKSPTTAHRAEKLASLRTRMVSAVAAEDYEQAAQLRDLIRNLEAEMKTNVEAKVEAEGTPG